MSKPSRAIVQLSGGGASYVAGLLAMEEFGQENTIWLFADVLYEDEDLYRFLGDIRRRHNIEITTITPGRDPWQVFEDEGMIGNTRADPCSRILKREPLSAWRDANCDPSLDVTIIGYDANEEHRWDRLKERHAPWQMRAPLIEQGIFKEKVLAIVERNGIRLPRLYGMGFQHNNCGGRCIKQGHAGWALLYKTMPERFLEVEARERAFRERTGKDVAICRDRAGGDTMPLPLEALRHRIEREPETIDLFDWGACQCMEEVAP